MSGYFQSERYFKDFAEEIRSLFQPLIAPVRESTAGVHLRMGDYLQKTDVYHTPDAAFLNEAFKNLSDNIRTLVVFSDSPDLARKLVEDVPEARRFEIVMDEHETLDALRELTAMQELVLSCSSFSQQTHWRWALLGPLIQNAVSKPTVSKNFPSVDTDACLRFPSGARAKI